MKRLLIIGASILQLPAIKKAKEMGLYVGVVDCDSSAVGIRFADEFFNVSTIDEVGVYETAKVFSADGIMTIATDMPMRSIAYACERLGLVGINYKTAIDATDKGKMLIAFEKNNVEHPWYFIFQDLKTIDNIKEQITYPCISKPVDNSGSRGVMLINSELELYDSLKYSFENGRGGGVIVEEYLEGKEVSVEMIILNGRANVLAVTDKLTTGVPHFVEMGHSQPSCLDTKTIDLIKDLAMRAVKAVGIINGSAHVEIMITKNGPKMIELGARMGGDCITSHLVPLSTGIDMIKATIQIALGEKPDISFKYHKGSAVRYLKTTSGKIQNILGVKEAIKISGIQEISIVKTVGQSVSGIRNSADRVGFVIAQGDTALAAIEICQKALNIVNICIN